VFECCTVLATQDKQVRAVSPWQGDPYDTAVSLTLFTVPVLAALIALRLLLWPAAGQSDRAQQLIRAVAVLAAMVGLTAGAEWAAVAVGAHRASWNWMTAALIAALAVVSALTVLLAALLARAFRSRPAEGWRHDWLGDLFLLAALVPGIRRWANRDCAAWVRLHAVSVFAGLSALAGVAEVSGMIIGEQWRDPVLISWAILVVTAADLSCCLVGNAVAGFVARPARSSPQRTAERAVVGGTIAVLLALAFRDQIWGLFPAAAELGRLAGRAHPRRRRRRRRRDRGGRVTSAGSWMTGRRWGGRPTPAAASSATGQPRSAR
jgi:hypothetical protein